MNLTEFKTSDLVLAAYLKTQGVDFAAIEKTGVRGVFVFHLSETDAHLVVEYDLGNGSVEPIAFHNAIKQLTTAVRRMQ